MNRIRLALVLHNHQPTGNFDHVFEQAYQDSYLPFLDVFSRYDPLRIGLHTSGPLMEWLDQRHPDYLDRLAELVATGRVEIVGGAFHEPILAMIPSRDRLGQIRTYTRWLEDRLGAKVRGMWMPERVWEQSFTRDLVDAGIEYTVLDDFHFKNAGVQDSDLAGYYLTEDEGRVLAVLPGSEQLRYLIPFGSPEQNIEYLAQVANSHPNAMLVFGDDGEKFGTWPDTKRHCYHDGWLERFFSALVENRDWIRVATPSEAIDGASPIGKVYLPDGSYREMTEWALPVEQQRELDEASHAFRDDPRWPRLRRFVRGGFWRNFKVKYPEADEMYARMMMVSRRLAELQATGDTNDTLRQARDELYRGQCNCPYWHGAFGGIYLPHLRNAVYKHLIRADGLLDRASGRSGEWIEAVAEDFDFDGRREVCLSNDQMVALLSPARGGQLYELDVRSVEHNLMATLARRPEAYHDKVLRGENQGCNDCASIHDRVVFKQAGLDQRVQYDDHLRNSLVDLFYDADVSLDDVVTCRARQAGSFISAHYEARVRRNPNRIQVQLSHEGHVDDVPVKITKGITLDSGSSTLEIAYLLENLPQNRPLHFAVEMNFAGLPSGASDRYFRNAEGSPIGQLGEWLDLTDVAGLGLTDEWLGIDVNLTPNRPTRFWAFPVETVSQSEGGFELVHQSVAVLPHWSVQADQHGRWSVTMQLSLDTTRAQSRCSQQPLETAAV
ncbi:MAG: alpha-amylase/4-alpha-glucanotransferase domain-containing protein [Patescibacteria group bacterium]|nr:alpha-amylase/4-alpha-glucanotransferase domain-containing protein [Patescibacteria group bacterium]